MAWNPILVSIQVGMPKVHGVPGSTDPKQRLWSTGIFKEPVLGPVFLSKTNLTGDGQADLSVHGGPDKAVLAYSAQHYPAWRVDLETPNLPYGAFGENFTIDGLDEKGVSEGTRFEIGEALVEFSQFRQPCWKLARRWDRKDLPKLVLETGRSGWYFRVLREGFLLAGQELRPVKKTNFPLDSNTAGYGKR